MNEDDSVVERLASWEHKVVDRCANGYVIEQLGLSLETSRLLLGAILSAQLQFRRTLYISAGTTLTDRTER